MIKTIITPYSVPQFKVMNNKGLGVCELFSQTFQGEGRYMGHPATFLRLRGCSLQCKWCDTTEVWKQGHLYSFDEIFELMTKNKVIPYLKNGAHLVITGGQPLLQQPKLLDFLNEFQVEFNFVPFIELENECTIEVDPELDLFIRQYNNSPKLSNSGIAKEIRYKPNVISFASKMERKYAEGAKGVDFKFVVSNVNDWTEIENDFLKTNLIQKGQIILMPEGKTKDGLSVNQKWVAEWAMMKGVRYSDRLHILIYNNKKGV